MTEQAARLLLADVRPRLADAVDPLRRHPTASSLARGVVESSLDGIMVFASVRDDDGRICDFRWLQANGVAGDIVDRDPDWLVGRCLLEELPGNRDVGLFDRYVSVVETGRPYQTEADYRYDEIDARFRITAVRVDDGFAVTFRDVTDERDRERDSAWAALHDPLTDLPNRTLLHDRIDRVSKLSIVRDVDVAIIVVDLDRFTRVNQAYGFEQGDALLVRIARRLEAIVDGGDTVARTGGDEFTLICHDLRDEFTLAELCDAISRACIDDLDDAGHEAQLSEADDCDDRVSISASASIGVAVARGQDVTRAMVRDAHAAMHRAKANGRGRYEFADDTLRRELAESAEIVRGLTRAIENDEIEVHYQPIFAACGALTSAEALVRWRRHGELISPGLFLPVAQEHGLMKALGEHVLATSLDQLAAWDRSLGFRAVPSISVNLAAEQLDASLPGSVMHLLVASGLTPDRLCLEVTESSLITEPELAERSLRELADRGVAIALDDFGTGYSPLTYIKQMPVAIIKIDRSFVARITDDPTDAAVVEAVVALSHRLDKRVVAEGVETTEQLELVRSLGIDAIQGFLLGHPSPAERMVDHVGLARAGACTGDPAVHG